MAFLFGIFFGCFGAIGTMYIIRGAKGNNESRSFSNGLFCYYLCIVALICACVICV